MSNLPADSQQQKNILRRKAYAQRNAQVDKDSTSHKICQAIMAMPEYQSAQTILSYMHCRSEVRTATLNNQLLADHSKSIVIPYCTVDQNNYPLLGLWKLDSLNELQPGTWDIPEPPKQRWSEADKKPSIQNLDLVVVPGVAFDRNGGRLGNGKGYYDRLLKMLENNTVIVGVGYESQLFDAIPMDLHDIYLHKLVTEKAVYQCHPDQ